MNTTHQPTIWMNVSTSAGWNRPAVGIVRVELELCAQLAKLYGKRFRQCRWQGDRFIDCTPPAALAAASPVPPQGAAPVPAPPASDPSLPAPQPILPPIYPLLPRRLALKNLAQAVFSLTPAALRPYFNRFLYALRPRAAALVGRWHLRRKAAGLPPLHMPPGALPPPQGEQPCHMGALFAPGDVLLAIGAEWHFPYYSQLYHLRQQRQIKVITCCYDLIPVLYPQYCLADVARIFSAYFLELADASDLILCISRQSQADLHALLERTGAAQPRTHVFALGDQLPAAQQDPCSEVITQLCQQPFILFVSSIERRKNHEVLYRAYHLLCAAGKAASLPKLVFVGMNGWGVADLLHDIDLDPLTAGLIVRLNHVTDAELQQLYQAALFCVYPSLYEGWGLPVGEALAMGKVVLSSDRGSLPEVGGDLVRYLDPWSPQLWADEIERMSFDAGWRQAWEHKVQTRYQVRTWADAARSVQQAIDTLLLPQPPQPTPAPHCASVNTSISASV